VDASEADGGSVTTGTARVVVERPPPGLARGKYASPAWMIGVLGGVVVLAGLAYFLWRLRRRALR
jgi:hypothetical protein